MIDIYIPNKACIITRNNYGISKYQEYISKKKLYKKILS